MQAEERIEYLTSEVERAIKAMRKAKADRAAANKRVQKWRNRLAYLAGQGTPWKRKWFRYFVPEGLGE